MKYTPSHEWIRVEQQVGVVGITRYAVKELGEIVYVQLPQVGKKLFEGEEAVVLESTKAAADIYAPVTGVVMAINESLLQDLSALNADPEETGWLFQVKLEEEKQKTELLSEEEYRAMINS